MRTLGEKVREFRTEPTRDWSTAEMAKRVGTTRQSIENLESGAVGLPHYLVALADVMDCSIDDLLNRRRVHTTAREPAPIYGTEPIDRLLGRVGDLIKQVPAERRPALSDCLAGWARDGGADHYVGLLAQLLQPLRGKPARGTH